MRRIFLFTLFGLATVFTLALFGKIQHPLLTTVFSKFPVSLPLRADFILPKSVSLEKESTSSDPAETSTAGGVVAGASIDTQRIQDVVQTVASTVSVGAAKVFTQSANGAEATIDVGKIVTSIQDQVDRLPATLIEQAKIEYCKQVLENEKK